MSITKLPCELINAILQRLDSFHDLLSALLSCRHVHASFQENPRLAVHIVQNQINPELLPYAVAVLGARQAKTEPDIQALLERLRNAMKQHQEPPADLSTIPFAGLAQMGAMHEIIRGFVATFSARAWAHLLKTAFPDGGVDDDKNDVSLSPTEYIRFCRAFYRYELYMRLFDDKELQAAGHAFLRSFPAWETEAIGCVLDFLELEFSRATRDTVAHDIFFGELMIDYLETGHLNSNRQHWLGRGIFFLHKLMTDNSFDAQWDMLSSSFAHNSEPNLYDALLYFLQRDDGSDLPIQPGTLYYGEYGDDQQPLYLENYTDEQRAALFQPSEPCIDADRGPFEAWWPANVDFALGDSVMMGNNTGFRERAYVLWDEDRLTRQNLLKVFLDNAPPSELELEDTES